MEQIQFSPEFLAAYRKENAPTASDIQWTLFIETCKQRNLYPGRHVAFSTRRQKVYDPIARQDTYVEKLTMITTVEAMTLIADRTGKYGGQGPVTWYYANGDGPFTESKIPLGRICHAASVEITRTDWKEKALGIARYDACVQTRKSGERQVPTSMWEKRGEEMTAKCARADAFRKAFPEECGSLFIAEEFGGEQHEEQATEFVSTAAASSQPVFPIQPPVNATAAEEKGERRPDDVIMQATPKATEAAVEKVHKEGAALDKQLGEQATKSIIPAPAPAPIDANGFDFMGTASPLVPAAPAAPSTTEVKSQSTESVPFTPSSEQTPSPAPTPIQSTPVNSEDLPPVSADYKAFTQKCSVYVRDVLPKANEDAKKNANTLFKAYLLRTSGKSELREITVAQWKDMLSKLAACTSPATLYKLVKE